MNPRSSRVAALIAITATGLIVFFLAIYRPKHDFVVRAYFTDVAGLHKRAPVRLAGMDVGSVRGIRLTGNAKAPVEVVMALTPEYASKIPSDSMVVLSTAGVLGETYVSIDSAAAAGPPLQANGVLNTKRQSS